MIWDSMGLYGRQRIAEGNAASEAGFRCLGLTTVKFKKRLPEQRFHAVECRFVALKAGSTGSTALPCISLKRPMPSRHVSAIERP
jgi:hypothetical protein